MSDFTLTGASAAFNRPNPAKIPGTYTKGQPETAGTGHQNITSVIGIEVELAFAGTIATPFDINAQATNTAGDAIAWTQTVSVTGITDPANDFKFTVFAEASSVLQPTMIYQQNYLVTVTDDDARTQVLNIALENPDGYPAAVLEVIEGYPSPRGIATTPASPTSVIPKQTTTETTQTLATIGGVAAPYDLSTVDITVPPYFKPGSLVISVTIDGGSGTSGIYDDGLGALTSDDGALTADGTINYNTGEMTGTTVNLQAGSDVDATYGQVQEPTDYPSTSNIITWTAGAGGAAITGYKIARAVRTGGSTGTFAVIVSDTGNNNTFYTDSGLTENSRYVYKVAAINAIIGESDYSDDSPTIAATPTGVTVGKEGGGQHRDNLDISWNLPADDGSQLITGYRIERSTDNPTPITWAIRRFFTGNTATSYTDTGLTASTMYHYRVATVNESGITTQSEYDTDTTEAVSEPGATSNLAASASAYNQINLTWSAPDDDGGSAITNYKIERESPIGGGWSQIALIGATTAYTDNSVVGGTQYNYRVRAVNAIGDGPFGDPADATTPAGVATAPQSLSASAVTSTRIDLSWNAPASDGGSSITGYKIERESPVGGGFSFLTNVGVVYNYSDTSCSATTQYNYRVFAINGVGTGPASNEANATTPA